MAVGVAWKELAARFLVWPSMTCLEWTVAGFPKTFAFLRRAAPEGPCSVAHWDSVVVWEVRSSS